MPVFTGTTLLIGLIRGLWRPKQARDDLSDVPWRIRNHLYAFVALLCLFVSLIFLSLYLDVKREIDESSHLSRAHSGLPLLLDCVLMIVAAIEVACKASRITSLVEQYRSARLLNDEDPALLREDNN